jgi:outer membrane protein OmpU
MNKITKIGCSALCGSLAAISAANAGDLTVTGGVDTSWISKSNDVTGNPLGMGSNLTFKGSGELDNGWTFDLSVAHANLNAYSAAVASVTMGGLGKITINQGDSSSGIQAFDDKMPTAWEEPWGAGLSTGLVMVVGTGTSMSTQYSTPLFAGTTITVATAEIGQTDTGDKASGGVKAGAYGRGYDATINVNPSLGTEILSGLNVFVGGHYAEAYTKVDNDYHEAVVGVTFDIGPVSLGLGRQGRLTGKNVTAADTDYYRNTQYAVAFNINDNLSLSYGFHSSYQGQVNDVSDQLGKKLEIESAQIAYTLGGASLRVAEIDAKNVNYTKNVDRKATVVSVALAF